MLDFYYGGVRFFVAAPPDAAFSSFFLPEVANFEVAFAGACCYFSGLLFLAALTLRGGTGTATAVVFFTLVVGMLVGEFDTLMRPPASPGPVTIWFEAAMDSLADVAIC